VTLRAYEGGQGESEGVTRQVLADEGDVAFETRYFEVAAGGFTRLERHPHAHVVVVLRGSGEARLEDRTEAIGPADCVYVAPQERHQFRASRGEVLGFLCMVDRARERPPAD
jgi:quercetin dioxygenase-like cupin family protein